MDHIKITDLEVFAFHGVLKEENRLGQKFLVTAELHIDMIGAAKEDDLEQSINYAEVCKSISDYMKEHTYQLIETTADRLAKYLLKTYPKIQEINLELKKPWAPILMSIDTVSVLVKRAWHEVYLGIGSNMGNKRANLDEAIRLLNEEEDCKVERVSTYIETEPVGGVEQDNFLNGALYLKTLKSPEELLHIINKIEIILKRERLIHWGPRTIDLDILFYDDKIIQTKELTIPHKELANRGFVLEPLAEIAPWVKHPVLGDTVLQLKNKLNNAS